MAGGNPEQVSGAVLAPLYALWLVAAELVLSNLVTGPAGLDDGAALRIGVTMHAVALLALVVQAGSPGSPGRVRLLVAMALVPYTRIVIVTAGALRDGLGPYEVLLLASLALFAGLATAVAWPVVGTGPWLGTVLPRTVGRGVAAALQVLVVPIGLGLGLLAWTIAGDLLLPTGSTLAVTVFALALGAIYQEALFRGLLLRTTVQAMGPVGGVLLSVGLYVGLQIGLGSLPLLGIELVAGSVFAEVSRRTGSWLGAAAAHIALDVALHVLGPLWAA